MRGQAGRKGARASAHARTRRVPPSSSSASSSTLLLEETAKRRRALNGYRIAESRGTATPTTLPSRSSSLSRPPFVPLRVSRGSWSLSLSLFLSFLLSPPRFATLSFVSSLSLPPCRFAFRLFCRFSPSNHSFSPPRPAGTPPLVYETYVRTPAYVVVTTYYYGLLH